MTKSVSLEIRAKGDPDARPLIVHADGGALPMNAGEATVISVANGRLMLGDQAITDAWTDAGGWEVRVAREHVSLFAERSGWGAPELEVREAGRPAARRVRLSFDEAARTTVGRHESHADVVLHDPHVSASHLLVFVRDGKHYARDLGSRHGTLHNGARLESVVPLQHGDELRVGRTVIRYCFYLGELASDAEHGASGGAAAPEETPSKAHPSGPARRDSLLLFGLSVLVVGVISLAVCRYLGVFPFAPGS